VSAHALSFAQAVPQRLLGLRKQLFVVVTLLIVCRAILRSAVATRLDGFTLDEAYHIAAECPTYVIWTSELIRRVAPSSCHGAILICRRGDKYVITAAELALIPLFTGLDESARQRLAQKAADIRAEGGDWVIREGEDPRFFAVLEGLLQVVKDIVGQRRELEQLNAGEFFGEIPILLGTANLVSV